ncbi:hypothetical protein [uncultured Ferrimonas sp.]|uniref:hypothetical protein n=1 Tax=uncultured Ferrimonas sp. TaxID=432640 RepID=UPI002638F95C|nr:hypothetical protein [uncultured Ferrimonas sp.]
MTQHAHIATLALANEHGQDQPIEQLLQQAQQLQQQGVVELHLHSSNGCAYGANNAANQTTPPLFQLCQQLTQLGMWLRLPLCQPSANLDELMPLMATGQVLPYFELDYVHPSPELLPEGHPAIEINTLDQLDYWREQCPDLVVRGHVLIGNDTPAQFELLQDWLLAAQLDQLEIHTCGDATVASLRQQQLLEQQEPISASKHYNRVEDEMLILIDSIGEDGAIGRYFGQAYGNGQVTIAGEYDINPGDLVWVGIEFADHLNLYGVLLEEE